MIHNMYVDDQLKRAVMLANNIYAGVYSVDRVNATAFRVRLHERTGSVHYLIVPIQENPLCDTGNETTR
jgi:hypothetical protein